MCGEVVKVLLHVRVLWIIFGTSDDFLQVCAQEKQLQYYRNTHAYSAATTLYSPPLWFEIQVPIILFNTSPPLHLSKQWHSLIKQVNYIVNMSIQSKLRMNVNFSYSLRSRKPALRKPYHKLWLKWLCIEIESLKEVCTVVTHVDECIIWWQRNFDSANETAYNGLSFTK